MIFLSDPHDFLRSKSFTEMNIIRKAWRTERSSVINLEDETIWQKACHDKYWIPCLLLKTSSCGWRGGSKTNKGKQGGREFKTWQSWANKLFEWPQGNISLEGGGIVSNIYHIHLLVSYLYSFNVFIIINETLVPQAQYCIISWTVDSPGELR